MGHGTMTKDEEIEKLREALRDVRSRCLLGARMLAGTRYGRWTEVFTILAARCNEALEDD